MTIRDDDPRLLEIIAAARLGLERQDAMARLNDPDTALEIAGDVTHALSVIISNFRPAIAERFHSELPRDTRKNHPDIARMFQRAHAVVWEDLLAVNLTRGHMLTHELLSLSEGDQPELLTRAPAKDGRRSSKPMSRDIAHAKRVIVLRAYYDGGLHDRAPRTVLAEYIGGRDGRGADDSNLKRNWTQPVPNIDRMTAFETGKAERAGTPLTPEQQDMRASVTRFTPRQLLDAYQNLGGTPR